MAQKTQSNKSDTQTRKSLVGLLKQNGPMDAKNLAEHLGLTRMAIRLHLYALQDEKLVTSTNEPRPMGRPAKMWQLTPEADQFFPNGHADLVVSLIDTMGEAFGAEGFATFLETLKDRKVQEYQEALSKVKPLKRRVEALSKLRSAEGYMAEVEAKEDGTLLLIENHCPICLAASKCQGLCSVELEVFQTVLGDVTIERTEHIQDDARRCVYRIKTA